MSRSRFLLCVVLAVLLSSVTLAQGEWFQTGELATVIDGQERQLHSYGTYVPEDVAEGVEDPQQRAILERVAGTEQHTASYKLFEGLSMGGVTITPDTLWLALTFHFGGPDATAPHGVTMQVPLDPATLQVSDPDQVEVSYYPNGPSWDDYYALTEGEVMILSVEVVDELTLRVVGTFSGLFTHQADFDVTHNPEDALQGYGEFTVERVVGEALALELIEGGP